MRSASITRAGAPVAALAARRSRVSPGAAGCRGVRIPASLPAPRSLRCAALAEDTESEEKVEAQKPAPPSEAAAALAEQAPDEPSTSVTQEAVEGKASEPLKPARWSKTRSKKEGGGKKGKGKKGAPPREWSTDTEIKNHGLTVGTCEPGTVVWSNLNGARIALDRDPRILGYMPVSMGPMGIISGDEENKYTQRKFGKKAGGKRGCLPVGMRREFEVLQVPDKVYEGGKGPLVGCKQIDEELKWHRVKQVQDVCSKERENVSVRVHGVNTGGLLTTFEGVHAFIPVSHVPKESEGDWWTKEELEKFIGTDQAVSVYTVNSTKLTVMCSMSEAEHNKTLHSLHPGVLVWGTIRKIMDFGVFVGIDGTSESALLHVSNMSRIHTEKPEALFAIGDRVRAVLIGMDADYTRLSLSTAELEEEPGDMHMRPEWVYENADTTVKNFLEYLEAGESETEAGTDDGAYEEDYY